jgi:hypothetical protein
MLSDRRAWVIVIIGAAALATVSLFSGRLAVVVYPPEPGPPDSFGIPMEGAVRPGGTPTVANFNRLRRGMKRHEVRSLFGEPRAIEGLAIEMWWPGDFSITVFYDDARIAVECATLQFKDGKILELEK